MTVWPKYVLDDLPEGVRDQVCHAVNFQLRGQAVTRILRIHLEAMKIEDERGNLHILYLLIGLFALRLVST